MCFAKQFNICECPPAIMFEELAIKPSLRTPLDLLGFPQKCCGCIPIKCAVIIICLISFIWVTYELWSMDKFLNSHFSSQGDAYFYCKLFYLLWATCFLIACGALLLGIIVARYELVNVYVWVAFLYCCSYVLIVFLGTVAIAVKSGSMPKRAMLRTVLAVIWTCVFLYCIIVVNSFKLILWYRHLGF